MSLVPPPAVSEGRMIYALADTPVFAREPLAAMLEDGLEALLRAHWSEVAHDKDVIELDPDWPEYFALEQAGKFVGFSLRRGKNLIGYAGYIVVRSLHYKAHAFAMNDVIYLKPEERGVDGVALILNAERALKTLGATKVFYHAKVDAVLGSPSGDSLEAIEDRLAMEDVGDEFGMTLPETFFYQMGDRTLGGVLSALGYGHVENHWGKLLKERA